MAITNKGKSHKEVYACKICDEYKLCGDDHTVPAYSGMHKRYTYAEIQ